MTLGKISDPQLDCTKTTGKIIPNSLELHSGPNESQPVAGGYIIRAACVTLKSFLNENHTDG